MYLKYKWNVIILHIAKREGVKNLYFKKKMIYRDSKMLNIYIITICLTQVFAKWILFLLIIFSLTYKNNSWSVKSHYDSSFEHIYSMWISPILELETTFGQFYPLCAFRALHVPAYRIRVLEFHASKLYYHITQHRVLRESLTIRRNIIINTLQLKTTMLREPMTSFRIWLSRYRMSSFKCNYHVF